jgi:hypothetical protein
LELLLEDNSYNQEKEYPILSVIRKTPLFGIEDEQLEFNHEVLE